MSEIGLIFVKMGFFQKGEQDDPSWHMGETVVVLKME